MALPAPYGSRGTLECCRAAPPPFLRVPQRTSSPVPPCDVATGINVASRMDSAQDP